MNKIGDPYSDPTIIKNLAVEISFTPQHSLSSTSKIIITPPPFLRPKSCSYISGNSVITGMVSCSLENKTWALTSLWTTS